MEELICELSLKITSLIKHTALRLANKLLTVVSTISLVPRRLKPGDEAGHGLASFPDYPAFRASEKVVEVWEGG